MFAVFLPCDDPRTSWSFRDTRFCEFHVSVKRCISDHLHQKYRITPSVSCNPVVNRFPKPSVLSLDCVTCGKVIGWVFIITDKTKTEGGRKLGGVGVMKDHELKL